MGLALPEPTTVGPRERIDAATFGLTRPLDLLHGQITPIVRRVWADVNGTYAIALGDAWITHDPIAAQGANLGTRFPAWRAHHDEPQL